MNAIDPQIVVAFFFGLVFVTALILLAIRFPDPTAFQYTVFRIVLALAAAGVAAMIPGIIRVEMSATLGIMVRAGGALAVFVIVFFRNPAVLVRHETTPPILPPTGGAEGGICAHPALAIRLANELSNGLIVPPCRDTQTDIRTRAIAEAARLGLPTMEWMDAALKPIRLQLDQIRERLKHEVEDEFDRSSEFATQRDAILSAVGETERFAWALQHWYFETIRFLLCQHEEETYLWRSVVLAFDVTNAGTLPAAKIRGELHFPHGITVHAARWRPTGGGWVRPEVPAIPMPIEADLRAKFPARPVPTPTWYSRQAPAIPPFSSGCIELFSVDANVGLANCYFTKTALEHGESFPLTPVRVSFTSEPARPFVVKWKVHASNQREDSRGEFPIEVREVEDDTAQLQFAAKLNSEHSGTDEIERSSG